MNAVIYARYSSHGQTEQSIEGQLRDCYAYAEREGYTIISEYIDRALTGRSDDRPGFQQMIKDASKKQFERIIVWKLDRFARNRYDSAMYKAKLKKYGVKVVSATENITEEPEGIILEGMLESIAEYYSANLAKHVRRGQRESVIKGTWLGGTVPFGYIIEDNRLVPDPERVPVVRDIFEKYARGVGKQRIVDELAVYGIRSRTGGPVTLNMLTSMLRNEKYIGVYRYGKTDVVGECPPLIDKDLFDRVQAKIAATRRAPAAAKAKVRYLLQGKAYCGMCGTRMVGESGRSSSGGTYHYYSCGKRKKEKACRKLNEKKDFLEWYVVEQTQQYVFSEGRAEMIAEKLVAMYENDFGYDRLRELEQLSSKLDNELNQLVDTLSRCPPAAQGRIFTRMEELELRKADADIEIAQLRITSRKMLTVEQVLAWLNTFRGGDPLDADFRERVIDVFVSAVYVYDDKLTILYNVKDGKQISYIESLDPSTEPQPSADSESVSDILSSLSVRISSASIDHNNTYPNIVYLFGRNIFGITVALPDRKNRRNRQ